MTKSGKVWVPAGTSLASAQRWGEVRATVGHRWFLRLIPFGEPGNSHNAEPGMTEGDPRVPRWHEC